jgi:hypothetical protein
MPVALLFLKREKIGVVAEVLATEPGAGRNVSCAYLFFLFCVFLSFVISNDLFDRTNLKERTFLATDNESDWTNGHS